MLLRLKEGQRWLSFWKSHMIQKPACVNKATQDHLIADGHVCAWDRRETALSGCTSSSAACAVLQCEYCVATGVNNHQVNLSHQDAASQSSLPQVC